MHLLVLTVPAFCGVPSIVICKLAATRVLAQKQARTFLPLMALTSFSKQLDTHQKALEINLDQTVSGSFAEIGAGQEVARWFLRVGGASGTVAKTVSAYDKEVSDDLYGAGSRYVPIQRLEAMLDREWKLLLTQLRTSRGTEYTFLFFC